MIHFLDVMRFDRIFDDIGDFFQYGMIIAAFIIFICILCYTINDYHDYKNKKLDEKGNPLVTKKKVQKAIIFDIIFVLLAVTYIVVRILFG